ASIDPLLPDDELVELHEADVRGDDRERVTEDGVLEHTIPQRLETAGQRLDARIVRDPGLLPPELRDVGGRGAPFLDERPFVGAVTVLGHHGHEVPEVAERWSAGEVDALVDHTGRLVTRDAIERELERVVLLVAALVVHQVAPAHQLTTTTRTPP